MPSSRLLQGPVAIWIVLLFVAFVSRVAVSSRGGLNQPPSPGSDQAEYDQYAWNVAQGHGYRGPSPDVADPNHVTAYRTPGVSLTWAALYRVFGHRYDVVRLFHCALGALSLLFVFAIARQCFNLRVAWIATLVWSIYPTSLLYSGELLSEPLLIFLFLWWVWLTIELGFEPKWRRVVLSGALLGAVVLVHASKVFLLPMTMLWALWQFRLPAPRRLGTAVAIPMVATLILVPWAVRNYAVFGEFIPLSTAGGSALLQGNNSVVVTDPKYYGYAVWDTEIPEYRDVLRSQNDEIKRDRLAGQLAKEWLLSHPEHWWFLAQAKIRRALTPFLQPTAPRLYRIVTLLAWGPILLLFLVAFIPTLVYFIRTRHPGSIVHVAIAEFLMVTIIFFGFSRYRYSVEPLCVILAAAAIDFVSSRLLTPRTVP